MKKCLIVIDMQNDFVTGTLANKAAEAIIPLIKEKVEAYKAEGNAVWFTRDTHQRDKYAESQEGRKLPIEHCIKGTWGWQIVNDLKPSRKQTKIIDKPTFGWNKWKKTKLKSFQEVELVGTCTDICVISNALAIKAAFPELTVRVDGKCCAGLTEEKHKAALEVMKSCQVEVDE
ncbi:MAG: cysteine hydrolase [Paludibacteraceae bacterium]|nr:cysteine hydrolase [Paludibacteraceae bacterium]MBR4840781.1 cysteine hydrolase [Paludibacteraceae bacterium]